MMHYKCASCGQPRGFADNTEYGIRTLRHCPICKSVETFEEVAG